jgi:hypothetical protein
MTPFPRKSVLTFSLLVNSFGVVWAFFSYVYSWIVFLITHLNNVLRVSCIFFHGDYRNSSGLIAFLCLCFLCMPKMVDQDLPVRIIALSLVWFTGTNSHFSLAFASHVWILFAIICMPWWWITLFYEESNVFCTLHRDKLNRDWYFPLTHYKFGTDFIVDLHCTSTLPCSLTLQVPNYFIHCCPWRPTPKGLKL